MELIKIGKKYLIKNSNGKIIDERERLELENKNLIIKDFESNDCQKETTKKIAKNKKKIKEQTALQDKENADGTIEETVSTD